MADRTHPKTPNASPKDAAGREPAAERASAAALRGLSEFFFGESELQESFGPALADAPDAEALPEAGERAVEAEYLSFWLGDELYAVSIGSLREIVRPMPITEVPRTPPWLLGVVTLRGTVLPVFDLRLRFGLGATTLGRLGRILIVETAEGPAGILTDRVAGVVRIEDEVLEPPPQALGAGAEYLHGILRREGRMLIVLDLDTSLHVGGAEAAGGRR